MTTEPSRQPEGIPTGGQFAKTTKSDDVVALSVSTPAPTLSEVLKSRFEAAKELHEANAQNEWVEAVQAKHPDAAYAFPVVKDGRGDTSIRRIALHDAAGEDIAMSLQDNDRYITAYDQSWDMVRHITADTNTIFVPDIGVFSLASVKDRWTGLESKAAASAENDQFAHMSGMDKARAESGYAQDLNNRAVDAYVQDLSGKLLAINPDAARVYVKRTTDVEYGLAFSLDRVEDKYGNHVYVDLAPLQDESFQDVHFDRHVDYDETQDEANGLYVNVDPGH